jgi:MFS transporter, DHA3 family, multidrug efflux protein
MFSVQMWGIVFGVAGTGFVIGGVIIAKYGLGKNPLRTLLLVVMIMGAIGSLFTIRELSWLFIAGIWAYMCLIPFAEAAEQTMLQRVVPIKKQGRVFGFAQSFEAGAMPLTSFMIAPIAQFGIIPYMNSQSGQSTWGWLVGGGDSRGIALIFAFAGLIMVIAGAVALLSKTYVRLSMAYARSG